MIHRTSNLSATEKILLTGKAISSSHDSLSTTNVINQINKAARSNHSENKYHRLSSEIKTEYLNQVTDIPLLHKCYNAINIISSWLKIIKLN